MISVTSNLYLKRISQSVLPVQNIFITIIIITIRPILLFEATYVNQLTQLFEFSSCKFTHMIHQKFIRRLIWF